MGFFDIIEQLTANQADLEKAAPEIIGNEPDTIHPSEYPQKSAPTGNVPGIDLQLKLTSIRDLQPTTDHGTSRSHTPPNDHATVMQHENFTAAWPWIKNNIQRLLDEGWTRAALLRRSKYRWPCGPWGLAWLSAWTKNDVSITIGRKGSVVFTYTSCDRRITQSALPPSEGRVPPPHKQESVPIRNSQESPTAPIGTADC